MKIVFNFKMLLLAVALVTCASRPARAQGVFFQTETLLKEFFSSSKKVTYQKFALAPGDRQRIARRLGYTPARDSYTFFVALTDGHVDGYALVDEENGEHLPITFAVKLSPDGVVQRQEIVVYREARGDEVRDASFRKQFVGKSARDPLALNQDIDSVSGATISSHAMAVGVKRAVVLFDELVKAAPTTITSASPRRPGTL